MKWNNIEEILKVSEKAFEKEIDKLSIVELNARIEKNQAVLNKQDLNMPMLTGSEITPIRKKLSDLQHRLVSVRDRKEKERYELDKKEKEKWRDQALKDNLHDLRYVYGTAADHLMHGTFTMDVVNWQKPQNLEFEIDAVSGHKLKLDLRKLVTPSILDMLLGKSFSPIYMVVEQSGGYDRHGKKLGYFQSESWEETHGTEIRYGTTFAIMRV